MRPSFAVAIGALVALSGCGTELHRTIVPQHAPEITAHQEFLAGADGSVMHQVSWTGTDLDGDLDHYVYAVDALNPDRVDASWIATRETHRLFRFGGLSTAVADGPTGDGMHVLSVRAVDRRGAMSTTAMVALSPTDNIPPSVQITQPFPSPLLVQLTPPTLTIRWSGSDPDGPTGRPVRYAYRLFTESDPEYQIAIVNPDSLRRLYAPDFDGWTSVSGDSSSVTFTGLVTNTDYLFVIVAFDDQGAYSPYFSLSINMLRLKIASENTAGPIVTFFTEYYSFTSPYPGISKDPARLIQVTGQRGVPLVYHWQAQAQLAGSIEAYRWVLDPAVLDDGTPRSGPDDVSHWSDWNLATTSATVGPFPGAIKGETHRLYVEARDHIGWTTLAGLQISIAGGALFYKPLLIVDDTRLAPDHLQLDGSLAPPVGLWPTAAEADTFLYARGGFPWRGYPTGTMSSPGIFDGFVFDTIGTRKFGDDLTVPIELLSQYRHVIWLIDLQGATYTNPSHTFIDPMTALRYMSQAGHVNTLVQYVAMGGKVWIAGGGAAVATLPSQGGGVTLPQPGTLLYDDAGWRTSVRSLHTSAILSRFTGRFGDSATVTGAGSPYATLLPFMHVKSAATDPLPPLRSSSSFYQTQFDLEFLWGTNGAYDYQPLDSLFSARGGILPPESSTAHNVAMTAAGTGDWFVLTGFNVWSFRRQDCVDLVNFVLEDMWGLTRNPAAARAYLHATPEPAPAAGAAIETAAAAPAPPARPEGGRFRRLPPR